MLASSMRLRRAPSRLVGASFAVAAASILACLAIGISSYRVTRTLVLDGLQASHLGLARTFTRLAADAPRPERLRAIEDAWSFVADQYPGRYLCLVDAEGRVVLNTLRPDRIGASAAGVALTGGESAGARTVGDLLARGQDWVGENTNLAGTRQVVAYAHDAALPGLLAVHVPARVFEAEIRAVALPWGLALGGVGLLLIPMAVLGLHTAFRRVVGRYRDLYDNSPCMFVTLDDEGVVVDCNARFLDSTGYREEEIVGRPIFDVYAPSSRDEARRAFQQFLETGSVKDARLRLRRKDGEVLDVLLNVTAYRNARGEVEFSRSALQDVTDVRRLEEDLFRAQRLDAVGTLAAGVAHDVNNCLTSVLGSVELAGDVNRDPRVAKHLEDVLTAAESASGLSRGLLTFSRRTEPERVPLHVPELLAAVEKLLGRILPRRIAFELRAEEVEDAWVRADSPQLQQVLVNLGLNARDAMPDGGRLRVSAARRPGGWIELEVRDTGHGIAPEDLPRVLEPFYSTKPRDEGTGLGLSIAYGIVQHHGGTIELDSEPGQGTTVRLRLPVCAAPPVPDESDHGVLEPIAGRGETVLVVEDDERVRDTLTAALRRAGYTVREAGDVDEARARHDDAGEEIRLCVVDVDLPDGSGTGWLADLRRDRPDVPAVVVSGQPARLVPDLVQDERTVFLAKPFAPRALVATVRDLLAGRPARSAPERGQRTRP